ncbi:ATP-dependent Clp protease proteolytic subunit [Candidatus Nasuia deltocephalinicola]|uniref:ATP-dependent Clp protease proteolytic subunit n=1 Tax=Candidatus Nasuia deltocephalincola TaxID=1160784 RepID=UPI00216AEAF3|nr:ATP-dependent Clp protease proteolytic subunit [Candidatus Nasuia deltocephalinicola]
MSYIPIVTDKNFKEGYNCDIYSKFLKDRIIFLNGNICENSSNFIITQLLYLDSIDCEKDIKIYINSNGGDVYSGLAIYDIIQYIKPDVSTICSGTACSMAAFLLSSGAKGKRLSFPNSRIMIHQPLGGAQGQASDIKIHAKEITYLKKKINILLSKNTNNNIKKIKKDTNRDYFMSPLKALNYGIIDFIILNE